jgi:hypothetical protein
MIEPSSPSSGSPREMLHGIGVFLIGVCIAAAGWFTTATSLRVLSKDVPFDAAVFGIVGLEAGAAASAYLFAWAFRQRLYWLLVYLLTSGILLSLSYTGTRLSFSAYIHHQQLEQTEEPSKMEEYAAGDAHRLTSQLAYQLWERRGRPLGSPEVDWYAAEKALACSPEGLGAESSLYSCQMEPNEGPYR